MFTRKIIESACLKNTLTNQAALIEINKGIVISEGTTHLKIKKQSFLDK